MAACDGGKRWGTVGNGSKRQVRLTEAADGNSANQPRQSEIGRKAAQRQSSKQKYCIHIFIVVFTHLLALHDDREKFVLSWIWNNPIAFRLFLEKVLGIRGASKDLLTNGYHLCREHAYDSFLPHNWEKIDEVFLCKRLLAHLPKGIRHLLQVLRTASVLELQKLIHDNEVIVADNTSYSQTWSKVAKVSNSVLESMQHCFLGEWTIDPGNIFPSQLAKVCRRFPPECCVAREEGNLTYFYEREGENVEVIAVHLKGALEPDALGYMRTLMEDLFVSHPKIVRHSMATLDSYITGFGPFWQRFQLDGGSKVSFYTHAEKLGAVLKDLPVARDFQVLADRYAHNHLSPHLSELILALFMWKLPMLVHSFLSYSKPYLGSADYDMTKLECSLGNCGPCAYQLYITKDFCSEVHRDADSSKFTLSYCSHPDAASTTPVQFVMAEHGFRIPIKNGSLFGFNSSAAHGTAYRIHTQNAAYMGCLVVNSALHALTRRRQLL